MHGLYILGHAQIAESQHYSAVMWHNVSLPGTFMDRLHLMWALRHSFGDGHWLESPSLPLEEFFFVNYQPRHYYIMLQLCT